MDYYNIILSQMDTKWFTTTWIAVQRIEKAMIESRKFKINNENDDSDR